MFASRIERLTSSLIRELLALTQRPEVISFAGGLPAQAAMPVLDLANVPGDLRQYGPTEGEPILRERIAAHLQQQGVRCTPEQVLITSGSQQGLDLISKLFIEPGTPVAVEAPSYLAALQSFRLFGARFQELELTKQGLDPQALAELIKRDRPALTYLIPTFQNPSGVCYSESVRQQVAELIERSGVPLVEDEPYRELVYDASAERKPLCARLEKANWMLLGTFSKTGIPGLRIGYVAASANILPYLVRLKQCTDLHTNRIGQGWCAQYLASEEYPVQLERLRSYYREQRDAMQASLQRHFSELAEWQVPQGGLFFWVTLRQSLDARLLLERALARNVAFMPGDAFYANPGQRPTQMRLNFSHANPERIERGLAILAEVIREQQAQLAAA